MLQSEYRSHDALGLAERVRAGEVSPAHLMRCAVEAAAALNPRLNALTYARLDESHDLARRMRSDGPFAGVPFLLKDSGLASRRFPSSLGSRLFEDTRFEVDATLTARFEAAGLIPFARSTVPEFCMAPTTEAVRNGGPTRNPWDLGRSPGGSSGGAAAAVAAGIVPMAHGSDGGGSLRIPASCCGLFGLKPSRGLVPCGPLRGEGWGGLTADGVLSRSVRDTAAALDAVAGPEIGAPYASPPRPASYLGTLARPFDRPLRIARWSSAWDDIPVAAECLDALNAAERVLTSLGHEVIDAPLPRFDFGGFLEGFVDVLAANIAVAVNGKVRGRPEAEWRDLLEPALLDGYRIGRSLSAEAYVLAITRFHGLSRLFETYLADYDVVLSPTLTQVPAPLGQISTATDFRSFRRTVGRYTTFLAVINASGQPAASLPLHWTDEGLPVGIQIVARFGAEDTLLRLSAQVEEAVPWAARRPPIVADL